jgi:hypothetical protein
VADQYTRTLRQTAKGQGGAAWLVTPALTGVPAVGVVITSGGGAWGAPADLIAAGAIAVEHWIGGFYVDTLAGGAIQIQEIQVGGATPATGTFYEARLHPTLVTLGLGMLEMAYPVWRAASAQTSARAGGAAARGIGVSTLYTVLL